MTRVYFEIIAKRLGDNSPALLAAVGVAGTIATAYFASVGTLSAVSKIREAECPRDLYSPSRALTPQEKVELCWKDYVPAAVTGTITVAAIVGATRVSAQRAAAIAAAYSLSEKALERYRRQVLEVVGEKKATTIQDRVAEEQIRDNPVQDRQVVITGNGETLFCELYTGRYFKTDMNSLKQAVNEFNQGVINHGYASLSDFYSLIGLKTTSMSDDLGWSSDKLLDISCTATMTAAGEPCIGFDYTTAPISGYYR